MYDTYICIVCVSVCVCVCVYTAYIVYIFSVRVFVFEGIRLFSSNTLNTKAVISVKCTTLVYFSCLYQMYTVMFRNFEAICRFPSAQSV